MLINKHMFGAYENSWEKPAVVFQEYFWWRSMAKYIRHTHYGEARKLRAKALSYSFSLFTLSIHFECKIDNTVVLDFPL